MNKGIQNTLNKIDQYIRKHYFNLLIRGLLISVAIVLGFFLILSIAENFGRFNENIRAVFFFGYIAVSITVLYVFVFSHLLKLFKISKQIDKIEAAEKIGEHFKDIDDKLKNTLQLYEMSEKKGDNLLSFIVSKRAEELDYYDFKSAISFKTNKKYLKYLIPPLSIFVLILFISPNMITDPGKRILHYNNEFIPQAPFQFVIENEDLSVIENEKFTLKLKLTGDEIPNEVLINYENNYFKLKKTAKNKFEYDFQQVRRPFTFYFEGGEFRSSSYQLRVIPKPGIIDFKIIVNYPDYTNNQNDTIKNNGNLSLAEGSEINWLFHTKDAESIEFIINDSSGTILPESENLFEKKIKAYNDFNYKISSSNKLIKAYDTLSYNVKTIKDDYPFINVNQFNDSIDDRRLYFKGFIKDDYGFNKLLMRIKTYSSDNVLLKDSNVRIGFKANLNQQQFFNYFDISSLNLKSGQRLNYYFEVWDNDGINGSKMTKSEIMSYNIPDETEIIKERNEKSSDILNKMDEAKKEASEIKKDIEKLQKDLMQKKKLDWSDKQRLEDLLKKNQSLMKNVEKLKKEFDKMNKDESKFKKVDEEILKKREELQKLMEKILTPEMKEMIKEMQKMMEKELKKENVNKMLDKLEFENEDLEKQLERDLEVFKQLDFEMKLQDVIDKLDKLKEKQDKLAEESGDRKSDEEAIKKDQEQLNKEFDKLEESIEEMKKANSKLEKPNNVPETEQEQAETKQEMQESLDKLQDGKKKSAQQNQQNAGQKMKQMQKKLENFQAGMSSQQNSENMQTLRGILDNLLISSFNQENLMKETQHTSKDDPRYLEIIQEQKKLKDDIKIIEDSLMALSKRQASISPFINRELTQLNRRLNKITEALLSRNTIAPTSNSIRNNAVANQQKAMESMNKLSLMLTNILEQMQKQSMQQKSGGKCSKPKPGRGQKPSLSDIKKMQQSLKQRMQQMQKSMKQGGKKQGQKQSGEQISEQMARMAAEQEMIRKMLQEKQSELKKQGNGDLSKQLNKVGEMMEENETDLVNKMISQESLLRQQEIITRLLESEKAERERDKKKEREAEKPENDINHMPKEFIDYQKLKSKEVELLKTIPLNLKPFYKNKVNQYFEKQL